MMKWAPLHLLCWINALVACGQVTRDPRDADPATPPGGTVPLATANDVESLPPLDQEELPPLAQQTPSEDPVFVYATRGEPITLSAVGLADGATYQWQESINQLPWRSLPGAIASTLEVRMSEPSELCTRYRVRIAHRDGRVEYQERVLIPLLNVPSFITDLPGTETVYEGEPLTLHVDARVTTYRWYRDGELVHDNSGEPSEHGATYVTPPLTAADDGVRFYVEAEELTGGTQCVQSTRGRSRVLTVRVVAR
jgi:hypothetical protein